MTTKLVGLRLTGKFIGADPGHPETVYADRDQLGSWEEVDLTKRDDGKFTAHLRSAHRALSVTDRRTLDTRPAGTSGPWETFRGGELPPDWPAKLISDNGLVFDVVYR